MNVMEIGFATEGM